MGSLYISYFLILPREDFSNIRIVQYSTPHLKFLSFENRQFVNSRINRNNIQLYHKSDVKRY